MPGYMENAPTLKMSIYSVRHARDARGFGFVIVLWQNRDNEEGKPAELTN